MDTDLPWMLEYIDSFLALPKLEQRKYQMARRMGFPLDWKQHLADARERPENR